MVDLDDSSIIAIHGLDGDREKSWTSGNVLWLRDLLPSEIPNARILTYGYNANTRGTQLSHQTLTEISETLVSKLVLFRKTSSVL